MFFCYGILRFQASVTGHAVEREIGRPRYLGVERRWGHRFLHREERTFLW